MHFLSFSFPYFFSTHFQKTLYVFFWHVRFRCDQRATTPVPGHLHVSIETSDFFGTKNWEFFGFSIAHFANFANFANFRGRFHQLLDIKRLKAKP